MDDSGENFDFAGISVENCSRIDWKHGMIDGGIDLIGGWFFFPGYCGVQSGRADGQNARAKTQKKRAKNRLNKRKQSAFWCGVQALAQTQYVRASVHEKTSTN